MNYVRTDPIMDEITNNLGLCFKEFSQKDGHIVNYRPRIVNE